MTNGNFKEFYRRNLPHFQPAGSILFVTFRLYGSIPIQLLNAWKEEQVKKEKALDVLEDEILQTEQKYIEWKKQFGKYDAFLDQGAFGPKWLKNPKLAQMVKDALHHLDNQKYRLDAYSIMHNHVHIVIKPRQKENGESLAISNIMRGLKGFTARECNIALKRTGEPFWQAESYDHVVRNEKEWHRIMWYVLNNPVKAGLADDWRDWKWSYCKYL